MNAPIAPNLDSAPVAARSTELFKEQQQNLIRYTDRLFSWLMTFQWFFAVGVAFWLSPRTWSGANSQIHPHIWAAVFLGGIITAFPVYLARTQSGKALTRHIIAVGQMLMSALLIHLTGGRIETHFHVFGSLAILSFYRDWRVLVTATLVVTADHLVRGIFWPQSVFGVLYAPLWRPFEHAGWVIFEVTFLIMAIRKSLSEMHLVAERQAKLEAMKESIERTVAERTAELSRENREHRELQALYSSLVEQLPAGIFRKGVDGRYVFVNSWFCKLRGMASDQIVGKTPDELAQLETDEPIIQLLHRGVDHHKEIMRTRKTIEVLEEYRGANGKSQHLQVVKSPVFGADGNIVGSQGVLMDITERKQAEAELAQTHKRLLDASRQAGMAEVATSVLHNVGNVLNSVNVSTSLIAEKIQKSKVANVVKVVELMRAHQNDLGNFFANDPKGKQVPDYLVKLAEHLVQEQQAMLKEIGSLLNNVIHIKEIVAMQQGYAKAAGVLESLKASDLVEDAIRMNRGAVDRHNIKIIRDFGEAPALTTDKHKVLQILINLIRNSKYACDDSERNDKQITLQLRNGDGRVKISAIDNGIGIAPENLTRIFNHGFTTRREGHGFGLHSGAIAAKELGGALTARSEGIGRGATFTLELPANQKNNT